MYTYRRIPGAMKDRMLAPFIRGLLFFEPSNPPQYSISILRKRYRAVSWKMTRGCLAECTIVVQPRGLHIVAVRCHVYLPTHLLTHTALYCTMTILKSL
jgi:hypothetical protein